MTQEAVSATYYLYCVVPVSAKKEFGKIGIGGPEDDVYTIEYNDIAAVVSNPPHAEFERSENNILGHQRVVQRVFEEQLGVPLPFATTESNETDIRRLLEERYPEFKEKLTKLGSLVHASSSQMETNGTEPRRLIEEALSQSAASAVRIRQLNEEISQLRSMRYEKAMEAAADMLVKKLSTQLSATLDSFNRAIEGLQEKLNLIQANVARMNAGSNYGNPALNELPSVDGEIRILREEMERLNKRSFDEMLAHRVKAGS